MESTYSYIPATVCMHALPWGGNLIVIHRMSVEERNNR